MIEYRVRRAGNCWPHDEIWYDVNVQDIDKLIDLVNGMNNRSINASKFSFREKKSHKGIVAHKLCIVKAEV